MTVNLSGAERLAAFACLPEPWREQAWAHLVAEVAR
jgi:hypothetical protein